MNKKIIIPSLALAALVGIGNYAMGTVYAEGENTPFPPMIQGIVDRFNLNGDEVRDYLSEQHEAIKAEREAELEERLAEAVLEGKITEEQKNALIAKMEEHRANMGTVRGLTGEEQRTAMEAHREEMHTWAEEQGIDLTTLNLGHMGPRGLHGCGAHHFGKNM
jgi:hypothetical protein